LKCLYIFLADPVYYMHVCVRACVLIHLTQDAPYFHLKRPKGEYRSTGMLVID